MFTKLKLLNHTQVKKNIKGIIFIIIAALCFSIMSAFIKLIIDQHHVLDIMFLRSIFALTILLILYKFKFFEVKKSQTVLRAPYDGFIQNRFVDEGTVINGSNPILEILDANKVEAHVSIPENLITNFEVSNDYAFEIGQEKVFGKFKRLAPMSASGSNSRLAIFEFNDFFIPGSVIDLIIKIKKNEEGIWLPINSLSQSEQGLWSVFTVSNDGLNKVERDLVQIIHFENTKKLFINKTSFTVI